MGLLSTLITNNTVVNWNKVEELSEFQRLNDGGYHSEWHQEGSSMKHTQMVVKACQDYIEQHPDEFTDDEKFILIAASLFHDIGKGITNTLKEDGNWSAPYHAVEGERLTRFLLWDESIQLREMICSLVKYHMKPKYFRFKRDKIEEMIREINVNSDCRLLYYINLFDVTGAISNEKEEEIKHCETIKEYASNLGLWNRTTEHDSMNITEPGFNVVMLCGVAGGGKTTRYEKIYQPLGYEIVSRDIIRHELGMVDKNGKFKGNKAQEDKVTEIEHKRIIELCEQGKNFVSDNLFIRKKYREEFIKMVSKYNPHVTIEYNQTSKQNHIDRRNGQIDSNVILKMMCEMDFPSYTEANIVCYNVN